MMAQFQSRERRKRQSSPFATSSRGFSEQREGVSESRPKGERSSGTIRQMYERWSFANMPVSRSESGQRVPEGPYGSHQTPHTGLPDRLKTGIEQLSGQSLDDVQVHYHSSKPAEVQALAYTQGTDIHVGPGEEKHLPHEAWHVVQQKQKRVKPTVWAKGVAINDNTTLEKEAEARGAEALQMMSASQATSTLYQQSGSLQQERTSTLTTQAPVQRVPSAEEVDVSEEAAISTKTTQVLNTMKDLKIDLNTYTIGSDVKVTNKITSDITKFNALLDTLYSEKAFPSSFTTNIIVGDLQGSGDITAGAKLARELSLFFTTIEQWKKNQVNLYLNKLNNLQVKSPEAEKIRAMAQAILKGSTVHLIEEEEPGKGNTQATFGYPAHNVDADELAFTVSQYGYNRLFAGEAGLYGSGPGYGSLGVLPVPEEQQQAAIEAWGKAGENTQEIIKEQARNASQAQPAMQEQVVPVPETLLPQFRALLSQKNVEKFYFGYFSKYKEGPKPFVEDVLKAAGDRIAIAFATLPGSEGSLVAKLHEKKYDVVEIVEINRSGTLNPQGIRERPTKSLTDRMKNISIAGKGKQSKSSTEQSGKASTEEQKYALLIDFIEGVPPQDMLSLYYASETPVGAAGDQSFIEAYTMRNKKREEASDDKEQNITYYAPEQQRYLVQHLSELQKKEVKEKDKQGPRGKTTITVEDTIANVLREKELLFPIVLLINQSLNKRREASDS